MTQQPDETDVHFERNWLLAGEVTKEDRDPLSLRPRRFSEYVGQRKVCDHLSIAISATKTRGEALDHVLLYGPPGLGKTTLASIVAAELGASFTSTSGPVLERPGDLAAILSGLSEHSVLFVDEIHRMPRIVEELLYPAMEDFEIDIIVGQGPAARSVKLSLNRFTLVGATTRTGLLTAPLRDRFGIVERVDFYEVDDLTKIVTRSASILGVEIEAEGSRQIAMRSRGTPRIANRLLRRARDYAQEIAKSIITADVADRALSALEVDSRGMDRMDRLLLRTIIEKFDGGPVGLDTLAAAISEDKGTIEDVYEPFLLQQGFLRRTPRGREATRGAYSYLAIPYDRVVSQERGPIQTDLFGSLSESPLK